MVRAHLLVNKVHGQSHPTLWVFVSFVKLAVGLMFSLQEGSRLNTRSNRPMDSQNRQGLSDAGPNNVTTFLSMLCLDFRHPIEHLEY